MATKKVCVDVNSALLFRYVRFCSHVRLKQFKGVAIEKVNFDEFDKQNHAILEMVFERHRADPEAFVVFRTRRNKCE